MSASPDTIPPRRQLVETLEYLAFSILLGAARLLTYKATDRLGRTLGWVAFRILGIRRGVTLENLRHAFPEKSVDERIRIAVGAYGNYATALVQMLWSSGKSEETLRSTVSFDNPEVLRRNLQPGRGIVILSGHFGCWEFLVQGIHLQVGGEAVVIAQRRRNRRIDAAIDAIRTQWQVRTIPMGVASRGALEALRNGCTLYMLGDQSGPKEALPVEFFGRPAATHRGAAAFALRAGVPLLLLFMIRQPDATYRVTFEEVPMEGLGKAGEEAVDELTRRHTAILEQAIRAHPDHWLWMHKRWKHAAHFEDMHQREDHPEQ